MKSSKSKRATPAREAAKLLARGYAVCRIKPGEKRPSYPGWPTCGVDPAQVKPGDGIVCGPISGTAGHALVCVDLDDPAAVRRGDNYLPASGMVEGRVGKPRSHRWYAVPLAGIPETEHSQAAQSAPVMKQRFGHPGPRTVSFRDHDGTEIIRLIGTGGQAVVPPSTHASGERREWANDRRGEPAVVNFMALLQAVRRLARRCGWEPKGVSNMGGVPTSLPEKPHLVCSTISFALTYRINRYLDELPASVSGQGGHNACYYAACTLVWGFALPPDVALELLGRFNARCRPRGSQRELRHKVQDAVAATDHAKPRGHLV